MFYIVSLVIFLKFIRKRRKNCSKNYVKLILKIYFLIITEFIESNGFHLRISFSHSFKYIQCNSLITRLKGHVYVSARERRFARITTGDVQEKKLRNP